MDYIKLPYGYTLSFSINNECNISCPHCYLAGNNNKLDFNEVSTILSKMPMTITRLILDGGEVLCDKNLFEYTIREVKKIFSGHLPYIRLLSNGSLFYQNEKTILDTLDYLINIGVNDILLSDDKFHEHAGIDLKKLRKIKYVALQNNRLINVKYTLIEKAYNLGYATNLSDEDIIDNQVCFNKKANIVSPYFTTDILGNIYICCWRSIKPLGNLLHDNWLFIAENLSSTKSANLLTGNILKHLIDSDIFNDQVYAEYINKGECYVCRKYL